MKEEGETNSRLRSQRRYFWKFFAVGFCYSLVFIAVVDSPLFIGKYLSHAWGGCAAIALFFASLYFGIKIGVLTRGRLFPRMIYLMIPALEILLAIFLFSQARRIK
ncbi:MAG: hypothetical protein ABSD44_11520 [Terracidiphilus sp.]